MNREDLQRLLDTGEAAPSDRFAHRLSAARKGMLATGWGSDLVVLVRQALEHWALTEQDGDRLDAWVHVPATKPWPSAREWGRADIDAYDAPGEHFRLVCRPWRPKWLDEGAALAVEKAIEAPSLRPEAGVPIDPLVKDLLKFERFNAIGQRDAIRSLYLTPPDATVLVVLPTGAGKSLAFQFAALHGAARSGMTVVVVPTVALALDQEARYLQMALAAGQPLPPGQRLTYHSGLEPEPTKALLRAIEHGELPILFTSPEALLGTLQWPLLKAAQGGFVNTFAIDEAHIVSQWAEFRPQFQAIAGFRDALRKQCRLGHGFRTLLLTATLTEEAYCLLKKIYGQGTWHVVAEVSLRNEPAYLVSMANSAQVKKDRLLEAIYHFPRPLLLYFTEPKHAKAQCQLLRATYHFSRVQSVVGGDMSTETGAAILKQWVAGELDVIVATSAFGLGVDQSEVRAVIHACVPESIDRWYQEVGRSGRDGCASVALLVADQNDVSTASIMAKQTLIGHEKAWDRWGSMSARTGGTGTTRRISLDVLVRHFDKRTARNRGWNLRTLAMMVRAGILKFSHELPPPPVPDATPALPVHKLQGPSWAHVIVQEPEHLVSKEAFEACFNATRDREKKSDEQDFRRLTQLLDGSKSVHELLRETYRIVEADILVPNSQGDCPVTRARGSASHRHVEAIAVRPVLDPPLDVLNPLLACFRKWGCMDDGLLRVLYEAEHISVFAQRRKWSSLMTRLSALGIIEFDWPEKGFGKVNWGELGANSPNQYVFATDPTPKAFYHAWEVPRASLLPPGVAPDTLRRLLDLRRKRHVIFIPMDHPDPDVPHLPIKYQLHCPLPIFLERLGCQ